MNDDLQQYIAEYSRILNFLNCGSMELQTMAYNIKIPKEVHDNINSIHLTYYDDKGKLNGEHTLHLGLLENMTEMFQDLTLRKAIESLIKRPLVYRNPPK